MSEKKKRRCAKSKQTADDQAPIRVCSAVLLSHDGDGDAHRITEKGGEKQRDATTEKQVLTVKTTNGRFEDISTNAQLLPLHIEGVNTEKKKTSAFAFLFFQRGKTENKQIPPSKEDKEDN